jgi:hypothetical protein
MTGGISTRARSPRSGFQAKLPLQLVRAAAKPAVQRICINPTPKLPVPPVENSGTAIVNTNVNAKPLQWKIDALDREQNRISLQPKQFAQRAAGHNGPSPVPMTGKITFGGMWH